MLGNTPRRDCAFADDGSADREYQERILPHVSRTFALTIPQLPPRVRSATTSAYLLCRIADTIEDEPTFLPQETLRLLKQLNEVLAGRADAAPLAAELGRRLPAYGSSHERDLALHLGRIVAATRRLEPRQQTAIRRCVDVMSYGMHQFQCSASLRGLRTLEDLDSYCYYVAGVVGEMLTELFCSSSAEIERNAAALRRLAPSFGQGLQMTNILKDIWEDRSRGACWLPRDLFARHGIDVERLEVQRNDPGYSLAMHELVGITHAHLRNAMSFTLSIPSSQLGIRRFCSWAIGLALLTLRRIAARPYFTNGEEVKISRAQAMTVVSVATLGVHDDGVLRRLFERVARGLPLRSSSVMRPLPPAHGLSTDNWLPSAGASQAGDGV